MKRGISAGLLQVFAAVALALGGTVAMIHGGAARDAATLRDSSRVLAAERPECPAEWRITVREEGPLGVVERTITEIPLPGRLTNVPEFHDCQAFITGATYLPLYAIFASSQLATLPKRLDSLMGNVSHAGTIVALPAAVIYSYDTAEYEPLGIMPQFNCLYLFRSQEQWQARMTPVGTRDSSCFNAWIGSAAPPGTDLEVRPLQPSTAFSDADYPPVARWDWDADSGQQYIGIKCGNAWCEVGAKGFKSSPPFAPEPTVDDVGLSISTLERRRVYMIKGWYDRQRLASWTAGGDAAPSSVWGTIIPHPVLGRHNDVAAFAPSANRKWLHVATAFVDVDYDSKLALKKGANKIYLCQGTQTACGVPLSTPPCPASADGLPWWSMIRPPTRWFWPFRTKPAYQCVYRRPHPNLGNPIPGTSRWRWVATDETTWTRCTEGCCEVH